MIDRMLAYGRKRFDNRFIVGLGEQIALSSCSGYFQTLLSDRPKSPDQNARGLQPMISFDGISGFDLVAPPSPPQPRVDVPHAGTQPVIGYYCTSPQGEGNRHICIFVPDAEHGLNVLLPSFGVN